MFHEFAKPTSRNRKMRFLFFSLSRRVIFSDGWKKEKKKKRKHNPAEFSKSSLALARREILINAYRVVSSLKWRVETRVAKKQ